MAFADIPLKSLRTIFITHHHSDHNLEYGSLMYNAWATGFKGRIDTYGPPGMNKMTDLFLELNAYDINMGKVARDAGVKTLVLTHYVPVDDPTLTDEIWIEGAAKHFSGRIIASRDLMEL